jgi:hypothetical protein
MIQFRKEVNGLLIFSGLLYFIFGLILGFEMLCQEAYDFLDVFVGALGVMIAT